MLSSSRVIAGAVAMAIVASCKSNTISQSNNDSCSAPFADCNHSASDGCEVNTSVDAQNCGSCGTECHGPNGTGKCVNSVCSTSCNMGFGDCNGLASDGCETDLSTTHDDCGACGTPCVDKNGTEVCAGSKCKVAACTDPFADCNGDASDGCEANLNGDPKHCGVCTNDCTTPNGTASCTTGKCSVSCDAAAHTCGAGCAIDPNMQTCGTACANLASDAKNCGMCAHDCGLATCSGGNCQPVALATLSEAATFVQVADAVYALTATQIVRVPKTGGATQSWSLPGAPTSAASDATAIYFTVGDRSIYAFDIATTAVQTVLTDPSLVPMAVAVDDATIFWAAADHSMHSHAKAASAAPSGPSVTAGSQLVIASASGLYEAWTAPPGISFPAYSEQFDLGPYDKTTLAASGGASAFGECTGSVYVTESAGVFFKLTRNVSLCGATQLVRISLGGSNMSLGPSISTSVAVHSLLVDSGMAYWFDGGVFRVGTNGSGLTKIVDSTPATTVTNFVSDANAVYWMYTGTRSVVRLAK